MPSISGLLGKISLLSLGYLYVEHHATHVPLPDH